MHGIVPCREGVPAGVRGRSGDAGAADRCIEGRLDLAAAVYLGAIGLAVRPSEDRARPMGQGSQGRDDPRRHFGRRFTFGLAVPKEGAGHGQMDVLPVEFKRRAKPGADTDQENQQGLQVVPRTYQ